MAEAALPGAGRSSSNTQELLDCWYRRGSFAEQTVWETLTLYPDPAEWWRDEECSEELKALATYALCVNPTTGAAEHNWSIHAYIHSKARNRLTNERVMKLVYLFQNRRVRDRVNTELPSCFADDEVEEGSDDEFDENPANTWLITQLERPLADNLINSLLSN